LQSARFCWRPDLPAPARIELEPIGETYFLSSELPTDLLDPIDAPAKAIVYSAPDITSVTPANQIEASLSFETTSKPDIIRLTATLMVKGSPLVGYAPMLTWGKYQPQLPPTRSDGQTHLLIDVSTLAPGQLTLQTDDGRNSLASITYQGSPP
jgi:hypothetical protein